MRRHQNFKQGMDIINSYDGVWMPETDGYVAKVAYRLAEEDARRLEELGWEDNGWGVYRFVGL